jgi:hypothetical protein
MKRILAFIAFVGVACGSVEFRPVVPVDDSRDQAERAAQDLERNILGETDPAAGGGEQVGVSVVSVIHFPVFIFGAEAAVVVPQPASRRLVRVVPDHPDLTVRPLPSGQGIAAIYLQELSTKEQTWGRLMTPALRKIFAAFVEDADDDPWLVVVDDVEVTNGPDPVPLTGYRWPRQAVEIYAACGIPPTGIDSCTDAFYDESEIVFVRPRARSVAQ